MLMAAFYYGYDCHRQGLGCFSGFQKNGIEVSTGKIPEENLIQFVFHQTLGDIFTFPQDNNPNHNAISERPSYSFDLYLLDNLWQDLKIAV
jgi:hypothetical protein